MEFKDIKVARTFEGTVRAGRLLAQMFPQVYTENTIRNMMEVVEHYIPDADASRKEDVLYSAIHDWFAYGASINDVFAYRFYEKSHEEKAEYLVLFTRTVYVNYLNGGFSWDTINKLENKWLLYQRLAPYFKREMIHIVSGDDLEMFRGFVGRHPDYVVKPLDCGGGEGVHLAHLADCPSVEAAFEAVLRDGEALHRKHPSRGTEMVLEEVIDQDETMASLHPMSVNSLRITTVRRADGKLVMYRPRIKFGANGTFLASMEDGGVVAEIDPDTGVIITDGVSEAGEHYAVHPNTGVPILGFQIPKWDELIAFVDELNREMPEFGYIGWDIVLSKSGWCVMEGNYSGEVLSQVILQKGLRRELEELIGWKPEKEYWESYGMELE